jgi:hypothetical protein
MRNCLPSKPTTLLPRNTIPTRRNSITSSAEAIGAMNI